MLIHKLPRLPLTVKDNTLLSLIIIPALFCLCLGIYYWMRLIGVFHEANWRFDLMPWYWRVMSCSLAVVYPVAACGLWTASRWGIILWAAGAFYEFCAYVFCSGDFGRNWLIIFLHVIFLCFYGAIMYLLRQNEAEKTQKFIAEY